MDRTKKNSNPKALANCSIAVNALTNSRELLRGRSRGRILASKRDLLLDLSTALNVFAWCSPILLRIMRTTSLWVTTSVERSNDSSSAPARRRSGFCPAFVGTGSIIYKRLLVQPRRTCAVLSRPSRPSTDRTRRIDYFVPLHNAAADYGTWTISSERTSSAREILSFELLHFI